MIRILDPAEFLNESSQMPVVDVRSPGEYHSGHIPGACNIPLFEDDERAVIGTIYKHNGQEAAVERGLQIAGPKVPDYVGKALRVAPEKSLLIHCWRGGMRSERMAELFSQHGFTVGILKNGYKGYRRFSMELFSLPFPVVVLGGRTGSGKTAILKELGHLGEQVIDLEEIAHHKGSVFGSLGQRTQPSNEQFQNELLERWRTIDRTRHVWLEDESRMIGTVTLPEAVYQHIDQGFLIKVIRSREERIERLVSEYAGYDPVLLHQAVEKIRLRLGGQYTNEARSAIDRGDFHKVADITLAYYDKAYDHAVSRKASKKIVDFTPGADIPADIARELIRFVNDIRKDEPDLFRL